MLLDKYKVKGILGEGANATTLRVTHVFELSLVIAELLFGSVKDCLIAKWWQ